MAFRKLPRFLSSGNRRTRSQVFSDPGGTEEELYDMSRSRQDLRKSELEEELIQLRGAAALRGARSGPRTVFMSVDALGRPGMTMIERGKSAFIECTSNGPTRVLHWGADSEDFLSDRDKQELMEIAMEDWRQWRKEDEGMVWIEEAKARERQSMRNIYASAPMEGHYSEIRETRPVRRVHNLNKADSEKEEAEPPSVRRSGREKHGSARDRWLLKEKETERLARERGTGDTIPGDEEMLERMWTRRLGNLTRNQMKLWMQKTMVQPIDDGFGQIPEYTEAEFKKGHKAALEARITDWLTASAVNKTQPWLSYFEKYQPRDPVKQIEDLADKRAELEAAVVIGRPMKIGEKLSKIPEVLNLQEKVKEANEVINIEVKSDNSSFMGHWEEIEEEHKEVTDQELWDLLKDQVKKETEAREINKSLKEQLGKALVSQAVQANRNNREDALELLQKEGWKKEVLELQDVMKLQQEAMQAETRAAIREKEDQERNARDLEEDLRIVQERLDMTNELLRQNSEQPRGEPTLERGPEPGRVLTGQIDRGVSNRGRAPDTGRITGPVRSRRDRNRAEVSQVEEDQDTDEEDDEESDDDELLDLPIGGTVKVNGRTYRLDNYKVNIKMRKFDEEPESDFWYTVLENFPWSEKYRCRMITPLMRKCIWEVEDPKTQYVRLIKDHVKEGKDLYTNLCETAKMVLKYGIHHHLLPLIFCDHILPIAERNLVATIPQAKSDLTALIAYINGKTNRLTGYEIQESKVRNWLSRSLSEKDPNLREIVNTLRRVKARDIIRTQVDHHTMSLPQQETQMETIAKTMLVAELRGSHKDAYDEAIKFGITGKSSEELAEAMTGIFFVHAKNRKGVNTASKRQNTRTTRKAPEPKKMKTRKVGKRVNNAMQSSTNNRPGYSRNERPSFSSNPRPSFSNNQRPRAFSNNQRPAFANNQRPSYSNNQRPPFNTSQRPSYPSRSGQFSRDSKSKPRKEFKMDASRLVKIKGSDTDYLWTSKNGKIKDVRLPCGYHKAKNVSAKECLQGKPWHCYECSKPGYLAPSMRECPGTDKHQYRPSPTKKFTPRRQ